MTRCLTDGSGRVELEQTADGVPEVGELAFDARQALVLAVEALVEGCDGVAVLGDLAGQQAVGGVGARGAVAASAGEVGDAGAGEGTGVLGGRVQALARDGAERIRVLLAVGCGEAVDGEAGAGGDAEGFVLRDRDALSGAGMRLDAVEAPLEEGVGSPGLDGRELDQHAGGVVFVPDDGVADAGQAIVVDVDRRVLDGAAGVVVRVVVVAIVVVIVVVVASVAAVFAVVDGVFDPAAAEAAADEQEADASEAQGEKGVALHGALLVGKVRDQHFLLPEWLRFGRST